MNMVEVGDEVTEFECDGPRFPYSSPSILPHPLPLPLPFTYSLFMP